jgi:hypothetical protein
VLKRVHPTGLFLYKNSRKQMLVFTEEMLKEVSARLQHLPRKPGMTSTRDNVSKTTGRTETKILNLSPFKLIYVKLL